MKNSFPDATPSRVDEIMKRSASAFSQYRLLPVSRRAELMRAIAEEMESRREELIRTASEDTHLSIPRLKTEFRRTLYQLKSYADACAEGSWMDIRIDYPVRDAQQGALYQPVVTDLRKMMVPLGPVVVFSASNFPFAYSTAGGDTACALAAGCTVVIKAHPGHAATSERVYQVIKQAVLRCGLNEDIVLHLHGASFDTGRLLVEHPLTAAVGFTGSREGGRALFDLSGRREAPIPVFAEMGSVNPVFLLPEKLSGHAEYFAASFADSITQSAGQFCTNPGLLFGIEGKGLEIFREKLAGLISQHKPEKMLHPGIVKHFYSNRTAALAVEGVLKATESSIMPQEDESYPTLAETTAYIFNSNPRLQREVFGPYSMLVRCESMEEMISCARSLEAQLTCSLVASDDELIRNRDLVQLLKEKCGRFILNGVPTGVQVAYAMHHGGPYPATTDSRFTAVGPDGIRRFTRPLCYQNWPEYLLPQELHNSNPLGLWRTVNGMRTRQAIS